MILSAQTIRKMGIISPFHERTVHEGMTFGLTAAGYDVRIAQEVMLNGNQYMRFCLASTMEYFCMPNNVLGRVCDKSSWKRQGLNVGNTIIEPGWRGWLTLELAVDGHGMFNIKPGQAIAQVTFEFLDEPTELPYQGKYQDQMPGPVEAIMEEVKK